MAFNDNSNTHTAGTAAGAHKPTIGEKLSGTVDSLVGKVTNNPAKVAEGEAKKHGDPAHAAAAGAQQAAHGNNHGSGLTGNHGTHGTTGTGTGLTGNHNTGSGLTGDHHNNHGTGLTGNHGTTGGGLTGHHNAGQPTLGERVAGEKDQLVGRATNNPAQYAQGEARTGEAYGAGNTGYTGSGTGLTGNHGHTGTHTGTGLTGNHNTGSGLTGDNYNNTGSGLTGSHHNTGSGLTGSHHNAGSGLTGNNSHTGTGAGHNAGYEHGQPTVGDKFSGAVDTLVGKTTNNPAKVAEGEAKRTGDFQHAQAAAANTGTDSYGHHQTGPNAGPGFNTGYDNNTTGTGAGYGGAGAGAGTGRY